MLPTGVSGIKLCLYIKSAKLKLCDEVENFGNFIANSTVGETDENVRQAIDEGKYSAKEDLDEPF